jgi:hypothetical protein
MWSYDRRDFTEAGWITVSPVPTLIQAFIKRYRQRGLRWILPPKSWKLQQRYRIVRNWWQQRMPTADMPDYSLARGLARRRSTPVQNFLPSSADLVAKLERQNDGLGPRD